ncbi:M43 family zinc metalloprotease [Chryseobacterium daeguense]|uniref:M43 family zinc metalloprotease n=1 Tax=Chryseobacterium daeguense TaxID=412438 RepID=UPI00041400EB|nr:M43 family zinc metalloprotease [Chryseobacterium daeguense]
MKNYLLLAAMALSANVFAQRTCGAEQKRKDFYAKHPEALARRADLQNYLSGKNNITTTKKTVITIPIVVHVLYRNATENISDAQIASQITVLNQDYRKLNADFNTVVPDAFKPNGADLEIMFCMATKDPAGNPTNGIERKAVPANFNYTDNYYTVSGLAAWDTTKYLNIWIGNPEGALGFASGPEEAGQPDDGMVIGYYCYGTTGAVNSTNNKGRTATHEIGHYFGLQHIWGEDDSVCGAPDNTDYCADTPATNHAYYGSPTFPNNQYTCVNSAIGAMFMNYMDYVDDAYMAMFTNDQKTIVQNALAGPRASLLNSNGCSTVLGIDEAEKSNAINVFPNPTAQYISIASPLVKINEVEIYNAEGRLVKNAFIKNETDKIDVKDFQNGVYFIRTYADKRFVKSMKFIKK